MIFYSITRSKSKASGEQNIRQNLHVWLQPSTKFYTAGVIRQQIGFKVFARWYAQKPSPRKILLSCALINMLPTFIAYVSRIRCIASRT